MLQRCCWFIKLRKACILIAVIDFIINLVVLNMSGQEFIAHIEQAVAICHCIGCTFLLGGALIVKIDHPADVFSHNQPDQLHHHVRVLHRPAGETRAIP
ncbi:uncharacterized protein LOC108029990 isoform X6 [Drosophila biarmipes]|uniref:uncharacterized protein LOC108029990 isoform X6 n=1 Tax=Drosophila biarmipes TaxID=125945 RepID=UPI0007E5FE36|nr:uncharacterized protein LOC108029990 isoform X6 [Drosophila biarmipes]